GELGLSSGASRRPAHRKSYQLGALATPVQIRTDPLHFRFNRRRPAVLAASLNFVCRKFGHGDGGPSTRSGIEVDPVPIIHRLRPIPSNGFETQVGASQVDNRNIRPSTVLTPSVLTAAT